MPVYSNIFFYDVSPNGIFSTTDGNTSTYTGPAAATGVAQITDNQAGASGENRTLEDVSGGGAAENATANVTIGADTSTGSGVRAGNAWTLRDTVTGEIFQVVRFEVASGAAQGNYLISEIPLVVGRSYETIAHVNQPDVSDGNSTSNPVLNYADYYSGWAVDGTAGADVIDAAYVDPNGRVIDGGDGTGPASGNDSDLVFAGDGNDTVLGGAADDIIYGDAGNDTLSGGAGNDTIYGDSGTVAAAPVTEFLDWSRVASSGSNIEGGFTQNTGTMNVTMSWVDNGGARPVGAEIDGATPLFVGAGEPFDNNSSLFLSGAGGANASTTRISFDAAPGSGMRDVVQDVSFRLNDIDTGGFIDIITINAFDANGNPVSVVITPSGADTVAGNTITAAPGPNSAADAQGSALVEIAGPVSYLEIIYQNGGNAVQFIFVSDIYFTTIPVVGGDDTIDGGLGADTLFGEAGNDIFTVAEGDVASGGDGDDTFNVVDLAEAGTAAITITGGEGAETLGDTLNFGSQIVSLDEITFTNTNDNAGGLSGFVTLKNGSVLTFSEIETLVVCFAPGTLIETAQGPRAVETLQAGDRVLTQDHGPQTIRWVSARDMPLEDADPHARPVLIRAGALGPNRPSRDMVVSPQHRILVGEGGQLSRFFTTPALVPAKALTALPGIRYMQGKHRITWHHFVCDRHEVVTANGCLTESLLVGPMVLRGMTADERAALAALFQPVTGGAHWNGPAARLLMKVSEAARRIDLQKSRKMVEPA